ncbi:Wzt carbohydrate-binding domain-containing protein [Undibacterium sp. TJN25]|uniref:Wzt carbohydrate-binding domain-containing protein n=1 Tax=Undibacterium sp. TJN25 TaxID=3413056 RepID=UPI003BF15630
MTKTIFDHIPKTAGTSVKEALAAAIGERGELPGVSYPHHVLIASAGMRRLIGSHIWFFPGDTLAPDWYYCTLLRDPVDRFLSQYYFHRAHREQVLEGSMTDPVVIAAVNYELEDYLADKSPDVLRSYVNFQATHFARRLCDDPETLSESALLETAISSLEEYDLVGVVSDTQGFIDTYCQDLGLPRQILPVLNVTRDRKLEGDIPAALANHIRAKNRVDHALCEWAAQRFQEQRHQISSFLTLSQRRDESGRNAPKLIQQDAKDAAANFGTRQIELLSASCLGQQSRSPNISVGEAVTVQLTCHAFIEEEDLTVGIGVRDSRGNTACGSNTRLQNLPIAVKAGMPLELAFHFEAWLPPGEYQVTLALHKGITHLDGCYHWVENATRFNVSGTVQTLPENGKSADSTLSITRLA